MEAFGIDWVGINAENGRKLLLSVVFVIVLMIASRLLRALVGLILGRADHSSVQTKFWTRQGISLLTAIVVIVGVVSIWFNDPTRLATALGLVSAGGASSCDRRQRDGGRKKQELQAKFGVDPIDLESRVYCRITDNWLELSLRFVVGTHRIRAAKDAMNRFILKEFDRASIGIASATYDIVGFPKLRISERAPGNPVSIG